MPTRGAGHFTAKLGDSAILGFPFCKCLAVAEARQRSRRRQTGNKRKDIIATAVLSLTITGTSIVNNFDTGALASGAAATVRIGERRFQATSLASALPAQQCNRSRTTRSLAITPTGRRSRPFPALAAQLCSSADPKASSIGLRRKRSQIRSVSPWPAALSLVQNLGPGQRSAAPHCALAGEGATTLDCYLCRLRGACDHPQCFAKSL